MTNDGTWTEIKRMLRTILYSLSTFMTFLDLKHNYFNSVKSNTSYFNEEIKQKWYQKTNMSSLNLSLK